MSVTQRDRIHDQVSAVERKINAILVKHRWPLNASLGYVVGLGLPAVPGALKTGLGPVSEALFSSPWLTLVTSSALLIVAVYGVIGPIIAWRLSRDTLDGRLLKTFSRFVDRVFQSPDIELEGIAWGKGQTYLACPTPDVGWRSTEIALNATGPAYSFEDLRAAIPALADRDLEAEYRTFAAGRFKEQFTEDRTRLLLTRRPRSFSDDLQLRLGLRPVKWSQLQFFWQEVCTPELLPQLVHSAFTLPHNPFPSSLCLHLVVVTRDDQVLLTKAHSSKSNDYPSSWACSVGEQLDPDDVGNDQDGALAWVRRALFEEMSVDPATIESEDVSFLSLTLEGDICNFAMIASVKLRDTAESLAQRFRTVTRRDNEFSAVEFISIDDIPGEMVRPSRVYHPSTGIRMAYAYIHLRGQSALRRALDSLDSGGNDRVVHAGDLTA